MPDDICRCPEYGTCHVCLNAHTPGMARDRCGDRHRPTQHRGEVFVCELAAGHLGPHLRNVGRADQYQWGPEPRPPARPGLVGQYDPTSPFEPIKIIEHYNLNFALGNVIKYVLRAGKKPNVPDIEDLEKARQYIDFEIARRGGTP
jgi:hypothetical protein